MHEMQTIVTDERGVWPSVCPSLGGACSVCGAFTAAFDELLEPLMLNPAPQLLRGGVVTMDTTS